MNRVRSTLRVLGRATYGFTPALVARRTELPLLLNAQGLRGRGVEIGVQAAGFSQHILRLWGGKELISVDPWAPADESYVDTANVEDWKHSELYEMARANLAPFGSRSSMWRMTSIEAAPAVQDESLDFVYLDARHDYDSVREDLEAWWRKVRPDGLIGGHDYVDGVLPQGVFGVRSAVDEFFADLGIPVFSTYLDAPWDTWVVVRPGPRWSPRRLRAHGAAAVALRHLILAALRANRLQRRLRGRPALRPRGPQHALGFEPGWEARGRRDEAAARTGT
jgi:Methyltransferase domain